MSLNLSDWALRHRGIVVYLMVLFGVLGTYSYLNLGQSEDPPFTFRVMVITTLWPGASAVEVERQVTDRVEEKLQESAYVDFMRSYSRPGESQVFIIIRDDLEASRNDDAFYEMRKKVGDIEHLLPQGTVGPFYNDEFGDTFGNIYSLTGKDYSAAELKFYGDRIRDQLLRVPDVAKVEFFGNPSEVIEIQLANTRRSQLGVPLERVIDAVRAANSVNRAGYFELADDRIYLRLNDRIDSVERLANTVISFEGRSFRLGDIATLSRGYADPQDPQVRFNGEPALALGVSMEKGGDIVRLGKALDAAFARIESELPLGLTLSRVADQPRAVRHSVNEFVKVLAEAVAIVLVVSFFSLGLRTGLVVALSIPLVLAMTFLAMKLLAIDLHKISLGALVLALGLLVDDAIIAVEMMAVKMEQGWERTKAASFMYTTTAFPMLSGTLVTAAGFLPIALAQSSTGEYTRAIFQVVTLALLISWVAAVIFVPYLGYKLLPERHQAEAHDPYQTRFYRSLRQIICWCVDHRFIVMGATALLFVGSLVVFTKVPQQFFPSSTRLELLVDLKLAESASLSATQAAARKLEELLESDPVVQEGIEHYVGYVGTGAPRFYLPLDQQLPQPSFTQYVLSTRNFKAREAIRRRLVETLPAAIPEARWRVLRLEQGPPVGYPVQFRVSGRDREAIRKIADQVAETMRAHPDLTNVHLDWDEPSKVVRIKVDPDRAQALGVSAESVSQFLGNSLLGARVTQFREDNKLIDVLFRGPKDERGRLSLLESTSVPTASGGSIALNQVATFEYGFEPGITWRRDRIPTITARADVYTDVQAPVITAQVSRQLASLRASLPPGIHIELGGSVEEAAKGQGSVFKGMPAFVVVVLTLLIFQLKRFSLVMMVVLTAPLGIIGVALFLMVLQVPFGFVAMLGTIALSGMIMRNSIILVDQIEHDRAIGVRPYDAVIDATVRRFRPIVLTALAAVLAMIPLSRSVFYGPMAVAIMGGLIAATGLTVLFLPALYAAWNRIRPDTPAAPPTRDALT